VVGKQTAEEELAEEAVDHPEEDKGQASAVRPWLLGTYPEEPCWEEAEPCIHQSFPC